MPSEDSKGWLPEALPEQGHRQPDCGISSDILPQYPCLVSGYCTAACLEGPSVRAEHFKAPADLPAYPSDPVPEWDPSSRLSLVEGGRQVGSGLSFLIAWPCLSPVTRFVLLSLIVDLLLPCSALMIFRVD